MSSFGQRIGMVVEFSNLDSFKSGLNCCIRGFFELIVQCGVIEVESWHHCSRHVFLTLRIASLMTERC